MGDLHTLTSDHLKIFSGFYYVQLDLICLELSTPQRTAILSIQKVDKILVKNAFFFVFLLNLVKKFKDKRLRQYILEIDPDDAEQRMISLPKGRVKKGTLRQAKISMQSLPSQFDNLGFLKPAKNITNQNMVHVTHLYVCVCIICLKLPSNLEQSQNNPPPRLTELITTGNYLPISHL